MGQIKDVQNEVFEDLSQYRKTHRRLQTEVNGGFYGGEYRDRTGDLLHAMQALSQLS